MASFLEVLIAYVDASADSRRDFCTKLGNIEEASNPPREGALVYQSVNRMRIQLTLHKSEFEATLMALLSDVMNREIGPGHVESISLTYGYRKDNTMDVVLVCDAVALLAQLPEASLEQPNQ